MAKIKTLSICGTNQLCNYFQPQIVQINTHTRIAVAWVSHSFLGKSGSKCKLHSQQQRPRSRPASSPGPTRFSGGAWGRDATCVNMDVRGLVTLMACHTLTQRKGLGLGLASPSRPRKTRSRLVYGHLWSRSVTK